jgi:hypothetical protein
MTERNQPTSGEPNVNTTFRRAGGYDVNVYPDGTIVHLNYGAGRITIMNADWADDPETLKRLQDGALPQLIAEYYRGARCARPTYVTFLAPAIDET